MLPNYLSSKWAEKVLFIGQTVLMFTGQTKKNNFNKKSEIWNCETSVKNADISLWNGQEHIFSKQIQKLNETDINVANYEKFVDGIKSFLSERLSEISVNQADLVHQLKLIKEFYMLGRGELFLEFIKKTNHISKSQVSDNSIRDIVKAFESAALSVGVVDELDKFTLTIPKHPFDDEDIQEDGYIQQITLNYKISWPLQLLFSPLTLERYNIIFRFLLQIKQTQYELDMIWCKQKEEYKVKQNKTNISVSISLRNQLMFFIHNLQYYIQVDVIESQFSILMNSVLLTNDFEDLTRAHNVFQTNILSLCFLLKAEDSRKSMTSGSNNNLVILIFNDIFHLCSDFCTLLKYTNDNDVLNTEINLLDEKFKKLIDQLINILLGYKLTSNLTRAPLSQLLLRLDFNNWFSNGKQQELL
ncbi:TUBGCP4 family protein [Megaselia abdita]